MYGSGLGSYALHVPGVHGDEEAHARVEGHHGAVGEHENALALANRRQHAEHLLRAHAQHVQVDAVELVKAPPEAALRQPAINLAHALVVHLVRAVEHHHILPERVAQVLGRLRLARPRRPGRGAPEEHAQRLGQRHVADVRQGGHHQALLDAEVLERVLKVDVADGDDDGVALRLPVEARLLRPLEVVRVLDLLLDELVRRVALVHVHRDTRLQVGALDLGQRVAGGDDDHLAEHGVHLLERLVHDGLVRLGVGQARLHVRGPQKLDAEERDLRRVAEDVVLERHVAHHVLCLADHALHALLHAVHELLQPHLDVALREHGAVLRVPVLVHADELDALALLREHLQHLGLVHLVEGDAGERVEQARLEVRLHRLRVRPEGEDLEQSRVRDEIEARELGALRVEERGERLLAELELLRQVRQQVLHQLVVVA
eukprot:2838187-Pyramimonas_sp.AAC.2